MAGLIFPDLAWGSAKAGETTEKMPSDEREYNMYERKTRIGSNLLSKWGVATPHFKREMNYFLIPRALPM
jgi:hypothetical protein